jgi:hypothetical protein
MPRQRTHLTRMREAREEGYPAFLLQTNIACHAKSGVIRRVLNSLVILCICLYLLRGWKVEISNEVPIGLCRGLIWVHSLGPSQNSKNQDRAELGSIITFPPGLQTNQPSSVLLLQGSRAVP